MEKFTLNINETDYSFSFNYAFYKEMEEKHADDTPQGMMYAVASIMDREISGLVDVLIAANKAINPPKEGKVSENLIAAMIDDENTDIEKLFEDVERFLSKSNASRLTVEKLKQIAEAALQ